MTECVLCAVLATACASPVVLLYYGPAHVLGLGGCLEGINKSPTWCMCRRWHAGFRSCEVSLSWCNDDDDDLFFLFDFFVAQASLDALRVCESPRRLSVRATLSLTA
jgi:hypothetical protein